MKQVNEQQGQTVEFKKLSAKESLKALGPGVIFVLTALGAGDLVDSSVSGSHYGYALMWALALATLVRFLIVNIMARFELCNTQGITLFEGYGRLTKVFPYFFAVFGIFLGHTTNATMIKGVGEAVYHILGIGNPLLWSVIAVGSCFFITRGNVYNKLENVMKALLAIMTVCFLGLAIASKPDVAEMAGGLFAFSMPEGTGVFGAMMLTISLVGAVAGSLTNFLYPHSMREKGWKDASYKKIQRNELLFSTVMLIILNLTIWVVGAEILRPAGIEVESLEDISQALGMTFGRVGSVIFYLGVFGALYSTILGVANGYSGIVLENIHIFKPERKEAYGEKTENDPLYKYLSLFYLITPLLWSLPGMPNFVVLTLINNMFNTVALPAIAIGLLMLTMSKKYMGNRFKNNWFESIILIGATGLAIWGAIKIVMGFFA
ncbi:MAG: Nramp family divalent metal transporter [Lachnospiraceae bacterium]